MRCDQGSEFYMFFKRFLKINNIKMHSTYNEGKSVVAERFIRTFKNKIFKHMTAVSKNVYLMLHDTVNKYNNTVHRSIKMKPNLNSKLVIILGFQNTKTFFL